MEHSRTGKVTGRLGSPSEASKRFLQTTPPGFASYLVDAKPSSSRAEARPRGRESVMMLVSQRSAYTASIALAATLAIQVFTSLTSTATAVLAPEIARDFGVPAKLSNDAVKCCKCDASRQIDHNI